MTPNIKNQFFSENKKLKEINNSVKNDYVKPILTTHGNIREITLNSGGSNMDGVHINKA